MNYSVAKRKVNKISRRGHSSNDGTNDLKRLLTMDTAFPTLEGVNSVGA